MLSTHLPAPHKAQQPRAQTMRRFRTQAGTLARSGQELAHGSRPARASNGRTPAAHAGARPGRPRRLASKRSAFKR